MLEDGGESGEGEVFGFLVVEGGVNGLGRAEGGGEVVGGGGGGTGGFAIGGGGGGGAG